MKIKTNKDCACNVCRKACHYKPGWFAPGEVEKVAKHLGVTLKQLFKTKLGVDLWSGDEPTFVLAPATVKMEAGEEYPYDPRGRCVFLTNDEKCSIHEVKPRECRQMIHDQPSDQSEKCKNGIVAEWKKKQEQISELLGREPEEPTGNPFDLLSSGSAPLFWAESIGEKRYEFPSGRPL